MHIPLIMEIIDNIVSPDDRRGKYSDKQILKILILLWIFGISHRSSGIFLRNHKECIELIMVMDSLNLYTCKGIYITNNLYKYLKEVM